MGHKQRFVSVVGARPQFVKLAPICHAFDEYSAVEHEVWHTGQHYDSSMSKVFFDELQMAEPDINLQVGSGGHGEQTGKMLELLETYFTQKKPDRVIVYGDTNSTLAACLAAVKLHIPVAHVEAGLRSFNRKMPEEINRVATDHCADRLYAPTPVGMQNLHNENLQQRAVFSGDVMRDTVIRNVSLASSRTSGYQTPRGDYWVLTLHRPVNTDNDLLPALLQSIDKVAQERIPILFPVHPRIRAVVNDCKSSLKAITAVEPLSYLDMLTTVQNAKLVITDSGGLQKEAAFLQTPCVTLREETEWTETVDIGVNVLSNTTEDDIARAVTTVEQVTFDDGVIAAIDKNFGAGDAARTIVKDLIAV